MSAVRPVVVSGHALSRARRRRHWRTDQLTEAELVDAIVAEVRAAFAAGRVSTLKPRWTVRFRERRQTLEAGRRAVWDEAADRCWIVCRERDRDVVVTALHRVWARESETVVAEVEAA